MNYGNTASMYPYNPNRVYNPYNDYYNNINNQTPLMMPHIQQGPLPPQLQPTVIPPPVILANTYLPKTYYEDIIDNLELVSLNMINDLKALKRNQKHLKVNRFDPNFLSNLKSSIREQFTEVEEFREKEKYKLTEEFKTAKNDIENFLREKFKPSQTIMDNFKNELKKEKKVLTERLREIEETVKNENDEVETILLKSRDPFLKYSAERVYRQNDQSELDFAIMLKKKYAPTEEKEIIEKEIKEKYPVEIEYKPIVIEETKEEPVIDDESDDLNEKEDDEEKVTKTEERKVFDPYLKMMLKKKLRKIVNVVIASRKMIILRQLKIYSRIKDFSETLLTIEEYIDSMIQDMLSKPIESIRKIKSKFDLTSKIQMSKIDEILKSIINHLTDKTTKVQINRTFSFFFRRYIFTLDIVPPEYFCLFEKRRIKYNKGGELDHEQQQFVLIMKVILNCFVYNLLLFKSEDDTISYNFKLIATIFYYSIIGYYRDEMPLIEGIFDNSKAIIDENEEEIKQQIDSKINLRYREQLINLDLYLKNEKREAVELQKENAKNIVTYFPDTMENDIEEIYQMIFPYEYIRSYVENETSLYLITPLLIWSDKVIDIMNSHAFGFRD